MRELCCVPVRAEVASEFLTERCYVNKHTLVISVSQSGETADTLLATEKAKRAGATVLAICNVQASSLVRLAHLSLITRCGRERAVAATKTYVAQVWYLLKICLEYADIKGKINKEQLSFFRRELALLCNKAQQVIGEESFVEKAALAAKNAEAVFFLGRKGDYAACREGSLKLKEVSYLFSEAYPSGELKHGTLALMERGVYGVIVATDFALAERNVATLSEIVCRGASPIVVTTEDLATVFPADYVIPLPSAPPVFTPVLSAVVMQYFAYFIAKARGCDVDKPRNLAKSVTVE